jgi:RHS repeat-associated protein
MRERDTDANGSCEERYYYLQNWRHDVVAIMDYDGQTKEKIVYDAYGRPSSFSPADIKITGGATGRPDGTVDSNDTAAWATGGVVWNKDIGNSSDLPIPDGVVDTHDQTTIQNIEGTFKGGWGILSDSALDNRKGLAGYEFDPILNGVGTGDVKPIYHVRHRVLASDIGKWLQKDPLGYHDSMDLYEYCGSDAIDQADSDGLCTQAAYSTAALVTPASRGNITQPTTPVVNCLVTTYTYEDCKRCCKGGLACVRSCDNYYITPTPGTPSTNPGCAVLCNTIGPGGVTPAAVTGCNGAGVPICCNCIKDKWHLSQTQRALSVCVDGCECLHLNEVACPPTGIVPTWLRPSGRVCSECRVNTCAYRCLRLACAPMTGSDKTECLRTLTTIVNFRDTNCALCGWTPPD